MSFGETALRLCGVAARLLGWTPATFWDATPAELAAALGIADGQGGAGADRGTLDALMRLYPDGKDDHG